MTRDRTDLHFLHRRSIMGAPEASWKTVLAVTYLTLSGFPYFPVTPVIFSLKIKVRAYLSEVLHLFVIANVDMQPGTNLLQNYNPNTLVIAP